MKRTAARSPAVRPGSHSLLHKSCGRLVKGTLGVVLLRVRRLGSQKTKPAASSRQPPAAPRSQLPADATSRFAQRPRGLRYRSRWRGMPDRRKRPETKRCGKNKSANTPRDTVAQAISRTELVTDSCQVMHDSSTGGGTGRQAAGGHVRGTSVCATRVTTASSFPFASAAGTGASAAAPAPL